MKQTIAKTVGITTRTLTDKLNGITEFSWSQVCKIQSTFFPDIKKEILFASKNDIAIKF